MANQLTYLFGGDRPWSQELWTASDDRVRGGSSVSNLTICDSQAIFHGNLDTKTLGGAGFASQRTKGDLSLDLSQTVGLQLDLGAGNSEQKFTLTVKDTIPERREDGRDEAGVSWEVDIEPPTEGGIIVMKWDEFRATYRGRDVDDPKPLDLGDVKRISLMMRSFFDQQDGDFKLVVNSIAAINKTCDGDESDDEDLRKPARRDETEGRPWWKMLFCGLL
ncbi:hypothetical protein CEP52_001313 [Fusarium oligoseptatum]|uniref:NADH:ubiquinone oxidoreductase intermediate-associated protein 30 domain-containing protein n=1 Tax=Fusarium oligoseptatum TaxID=2604345 RepID=A0A428UJR8_9HYPO|nr:hypothetical protein CEP52_001313 [Fusarium oligoseptatum]